MSHFVLTPSACCGIGLVESYSFGSNIRYCMIFVFQITVLRLEAEVQALRIRVLLLKPYAACQSQGHSMLDMRPDAISDFRCISSPPNIGLSDWNAAAGCCGK